jgi:hypothetical protein
MAQIYPEPTVYVQTEACYRDYRRRMANLFPFCPVGPEVEEITTDQLVAVLNSAAENGPTRHYVLLEEK